jgi:hypothetical protein
MVNPACAFLRLGVVVRGPEDVRRLGTGTFNRSRTWKNASLSISTSPVGLYSGGNVRLVVGTVGVLSSIAGVLLDSLIRSKDAKVDATL